MFFFDVAIIDGTVTVQKIESVSISVSGYVDCLFMKNIHGREAGSIKMLYLSGITYIFGASTFNDL